MEDLLGIFLVFYELAEVMQGFQRAETCFRPVRMHMHGLCAARVKLVIHFHIGDMNTINIDVNREMTFLQSPSSDKIRVNQKLDEEPNIPDFLGVNLVNFERSHRHETASDASLYRTS